VGVAVILERQGGVEAIAGETVHDRLALLAAVFHAVPGVRTPVRYAAILGHDPARFGVTGLEAAELQIGLVNDRPAIARNEQGGVGVELAIGGRHPVAGGLVLGIPVGLQADIATQRTPFGIGAGVEVDADARRADRIVETLIAIIGGKDHLVGG